jgi:hypothetical protein
MRLRALARPSVALALRERACDATIRKAYKWDLRSPPIRGIPKWRKTFGMATPGQLVQVMTDTLGVSKATVTQYDRVLAEKGLRSRGGRGTSAAKITSCDAANLLIALAASPILGLSAKDAAANCEAYASLPVLGDVNATRKNFAKFGLPTLAGLPKWHSFGETLSDLIDAAARGEVFKLPGGKPYSRNTLFEVRFSGPSPRRAEILVDGTKDFGLSAKLTYLKIVTKTESQRKLLTKTSWKSPDLHRISTVSFRTIQSLGSLV